MSSPTLHPPSSFPSQGTLGEGSILSTASTTSSTSTIRPKRPLHLQPPTGINILPPSPIDTSSGSSLHRIPSPVSKDKESAPLSGSGSGSVSGRGSKPRHGKSGGGGGCGPYAADSLSVSPSNDPGLLLSPTRTLSDDPIASGSASGSGSGSRPLGIRSPAPSSPNYRPKRTGHHRRTSSSHQVRETVDGEQKTTAEGRLVNQYRIGKSLGQGAYAKVELAVDITTGKEYAIKEYSKSRLSYQALQERQRQSTRSRLRKAQRRKERSHWERASQKVGLTVASAISETPVSGGPWAHSEDMDEDPLGLIRREIAVMKKLDHPNIILLYEAISVPDADALFLVLEYLPGGTLMEVHVGGDTSAAKPPFPREQAREYFRQLCLGLEYLHHNEVVHRDIKPDNVLLSADRETVKLCDFGVSEMFVSQDDRIKHTGGSPAFLSPESFQSNTSDVHGKAVDIWALGVTLYCMLTGKLPFNVENPIDLFDAVRTQQPDIPKEWDRDLKDLVTRFLKKDPAQRIRMSQIRQHPWTTAHGSEEMISKDDNLYYVGQQVLEPTQEELGLAIRPLRGIFTLIRAIQKMRRLGRLRRSLSGATSGSSIPSGSMDSYASNTTSATEIDVDDADRQKALGLIYDDPHARSQSPLSLTGESDLELDEVIEDLKLDPTAPDSPGLRETLRQGLRGLRIETRSASGSIRHHSALNSHHHHAHHPESTHRHPHHIHHLRHHIRSRRSRRGDQTTGGSGTGTGSGETERKGARGDDGGVPDLGLKSGDGSRRRTRSRIRARYRESRESRRSKRQSKQEQKSQSQPQPQSQTRQSKGKGKAPEKTEKQDKPTRPRLGINTTPTPGTPFRGNNTARAGCDVGVAGGSGNGAEGAPFEITDSPVEEGDDSGFEITDSPTSASFSITDTDTNTSDTGDTGNLDPNEGVQIYDSPTDESEDYGNGNGNEVQLVDSPTGDDGGFQITDSPTSTSNSDSLDPPAREGPGAGEGAGAPITLMDSPSSI